MATIAFAAIAAVGAVPPRVSPRLVRALSVAVAAQPLVRRHKPRVQRVQAERGLRLLFDDDDRQRVRAEQLCVGPPERRLLSAHWPPVAEQRMLVGRLPELQPQLALVSLKALSVGRAQSRWRQSRAPDATFTFLDQTLAQLLVHL
eukprot:3198838-Pleurochrysis_carterae.AAC.4